MTYFKLTPPPPTTKSVSPSSAGDTSGRASPANPVPPTTGSNSSSDKSSLRPPSSRNAARRSSSDTPEGGGPRKALFVRPDQVCFPLFPSVWSVVTRIPADPLRYVELADTTHSFRYPLAHSFTLLLLVIRTVYMPPLVYLTFVTLP